MLLFVISASSVFFYFRWKLQLCDCHVRNYDTVASDTGSLWYSWEEVTGMKPDNLGPPQYEVESGLSTERVYVPQPNIGL